MAGTLVAVEGGLLPPDLLDRIAAGDAEGQDAPAFGLGGNRRLIDEVQRAFSDARAEWNAFQVRLGRSSESVTTLTRQYWAVPLLEILGFQSLRTQRGHVEAGGQRYDISHIAGEADDAPPVHIVASGLPLDARAGRRSPHSSVQEYLNRSDAVWGMVTNGEQLRLLRDSERFTRPTYVEFDLRGIFEGNQYSEFALAYRLLHRSRFPTDGASVSDSWLEKYFHLGIDEGGRVRERLRDGVEDALRSLGQGLLSHPQSGALREALQAGRLDVAGYYRQLLRLVYRLLFLMVAEERRLIFPEDGGSDDRAAAYRRYYSVAALRDRCEHFFAGDGHHDLWLGLMQTFRIFRSRGDAEPLGLEPLDSELFGPRACSDLEGAACSNEELLRAMLNLSTFLDDDRGGARRRGRMRTSRAVRRRVNYAALDVEELGSVYEALLDLQPRIQQPVSESGYPTFDLVQGSERKQTGSYYTPPDLVHELVGSALVPIINERLTEAGTREEREQALLALRVLDPASGSGHFLLAAARRIAVELSLVRAGDDGYSPAEYREALRDVIRHCIYAVDKNPLAVDLCKVALWIESHSPGLPLSFLDHHVKCGDSLVGVSDLDRLHAGISDGAYKPVGGDDKAAATWYRKRNAGERKGQLALGHDPAAPAEWAEDFEAFADLDERSPDEVQAKESIYAQLRSDGTRWWDYKTACDLWTYAFFAPLQRAGADGHGRVPTTNDVRDALASSTRPARLIGTATGVAQEQRFFHWPLEFPDVFERGGFDVVLGNPPWDQLQPEEIPFFHSEGVVDIATLSGARRKGAIAQLDDTDPELASRWRAYKRNIEVTSKFLRQSDCYPLTAVGKINTYSVFTEKARSVTSRLGRVGFIVPSGIATDDTAKRFFADLINSRSLVSLLDFENREGIFPGVHRSYKFCLLTLAGRERPASEAEFAFFLHGTEQLAERERRFSLSPRDLALFNPNTLTAPTFRASRDADIARKLYQSAGVFWREARDGTSEANPWGAVFQTVFNMTTDSALFRTQEQLSMAGWHLDGNVFTRGQESYLPLYEAKLFHQYDHRFATFEGADAQARRGGKARDLTAAEKADRRSVAIPRYWVPAPEVAQRLEKVASNRSAIMSSRPRAPRTTGARLTLRDVVRATDERTGILSMIPLYAVGHTAAVIVTGPSPSETSRGADRRTAIPAMMRESAANEGAQLIHLDGGRWLQAIRDITDATNERTLITGHIGQAGAGHTAPLLNFEHSRAVGSALILANMNSLPLDWASRVSVGGTHMSHFIVKQLPVLPPAAYLETAASGETYVEMVVPRVLELTYTSHEMRGFAEDLGYDGPPWEWDEERRHRLKCELDAIFAHMYRLDRADLEWILDAQPPSESFPGLKRAEMREFGEYRTQRYVLTAYDAMARGAVPDLGPVRDDTGAGALSE